MTKRLTAIGAGTAALAAAVIMLSPKNVDIEGSYRVIETSSISSKIVVELPYEQVPGATFYSLVFGDSELGISPFGDSFGVNTAKALLNPVEALGLIVYDNERKPIGNGVFSSDGRVTVSVKESETEQ